MPRAAVELISFPYMRGPRGKGEVVRLGFALLCPVQTLLGWALQPGPKWLAVALGLGKAWMCLRSEAPSLQEKCVSTWTGIWLHIPSQSSRDVNFQKGGLPCGFMSVILGFKLFMHEKLL